MIKKLIIKIARILNYELIDQNKFISPTLNSEINDSLSDINKSIVLPLGKVNLTKKIKNLKIIFRTNSNIHIWDQNKKRIFDEPKNEYAKRSLYSLVKSIKNLNEKYPSIKVNLDIVENNSEKKNLEEFEKIIFDKKIKYKIINHNNSVHESEIKKQKNIETYSNLSSLLKCYQIAKNESDYVEKAIKFSEKKEYLIDLKAEIRNFALKSPLFNTKNYSEDFYEMLLNIKK